MLVLGVHTPVAVVAVHQTGVSGGRTGGTGDAFLLGDGWRGPSDDEVVAGAEIVVGDEGYGEDGQETQGGRVFLEGVGEEVEQGQA